MASVTVASNNNFGKWVPYYNKAFNLGTSEDGGAGSTDGVEYITQATGTSAVDMTGSCTSELNCDFYYKIIIEEVSGTDYFYVTKYSSSDTLVDTIYASGSTGNEKFWLMTSASPISIDEGVQIYFKNPSGYDDGDVYKVTLPSRETMRRRRIYHGGYSTFARMPYTEGVAYHTDVIPSNLVGKNMTILFNPMVLVTLLLDVDSPNYGVYSTSSKEDSTGNKAISLALEWNVDRSGANSITAPTTSTYDFPANETWQLGTIFMDDVQPTSTDLPALGHAPQSDVTPENPTTGSAQRLNTSVSGRAGIAKMSIHYASGAGSSNILAHNQYFKIILMLS